MSHLQSQAVRGRSIVNRSPFFYGWIITLAGTLGMIMTSPGQTYAVSIFLEYFIADLGVSRSLISTLYTAGTLMGSMALPIVGRQIDGRGARLVMTTVATLFGLACIYMGFVLNALMLGLGFVAIRMLGQGSLMLVSQNVINQWWVRRRGTMMGISGMTVSLLGLGAFPNLINWMIPTYGWRTTYLLLGLMLLAIMAPVAYIFVRNRPELYGLQPDGRKYLSADENLSTTEPLEENWTLRAAMRTPIFWTLASGVALIAMLGTGLIFHIVSIFHDNGLSATMAASIFVPIAVTTATVNLASGILVDRIRVNYLLATALIFLTVALLMVQALYSVWIALLYGALLGTTLALMHILNSVGWAKYFGRQFLGSITGVTTTIMIAGSALGPMPLGIARDLMGSYGLITSAAAAVPLLLAIASLFIGLPHKRDSG